MRSLLLAGGLLLLGGAAVAWRSTEHPAAVPQPRADVTAPAAILPGAAGARVAAAADASATSPIQSVLNVQTPMRYGDYVWNDDGVPAGPVWVRVDLKHQLLSIFRAGHEIGTTVILYGADAKPTPIGDFPVLARFKDHRSGPYDAPMPYTLRLTPDGVSIHGSNVRWGAATHGCVGVPLAFAEKLFPQVAVGTRVTIVDGRQPGAGKDA